LAEKTNNEASLLEISLNLFAERGYEAVGIQEIVSNAGVTKPTLYHYFGSKQGMLDALLAKYLHPHIDEIRREAQYTGDLPLTLYKIAEVYFNFAKKHPVFYRFQSSLWLSPPDSTTYTLILPFIKEQYIILEKLFISAVANHGNLRGHHTAYVITFIGIINNYIAFAQTGHTVLNDQLTHQSVKQFMYGIYSL
jgi:TetR/AcrR family transcriptional regulator